MQTIPNLTDEPFHTLRCTLDEQDYTLEFLYSTRAESYSLNLFDAEDNPLVMGLKVYVGVDLLAPYRRETRLPPGMLMATSLGADNSAPKLGELGQGRRVELTYFSADEIVEAKAELAAEQAENLSA